MNTETLDKKLIALHALIDALPSYKKPKSHVIREQMSRFDYGCRHIISQNKHEGDSVKVEKAIDGLTGMFEQLDIRKQSIFLEDNRELLDVFHREGDTFAYNALESLINLAFLGLIISLWAIGTWSLLPTVGGIAGSALLVVLTQNAFTYYRKVHNPASSVYFSTRRIFHTYYDMMLPDEPQPSLRKNLVSFFSTLGKHQGAKLVDVNDKLEDLIVAV